MHRCGVSSAELVQTFMRSSLLMVDGQWDRLGISAGECKDLPQCQAKQTFANFYLLTMRGMRMCKHIQNMYSIRNMYACGVRLINPTKCWINIPPLPTGPRSGNNALLPGHGPVIIHYYRATAVIMHYYRATVR